MALGSIRDIYSQATLAAEKKLAEVEAAKPGEYQSNYGETLNGLMDQILNQKDFSYDFNADPLYQQYKDNYTQLGKQASMDAAANVSALTGGFGNSYAATAATQANQQYLNQLNNVIPELYQLAMDKYQMDTDKMYNQFSAAGTQEDREYGQYRDTVNDWYTDRDYYLSKLNSSISNDQYVAGYNQSGAQTASSNGSSSGKSNSSGTSEKTLSTVSTATFNMMNAGNTEKAYSYLDQKVQQGQITEEEANAILDKIEGTPLLNTHSNIFTSGKR